MRRVRLKQTPMGNREDWLGSASGRSQGPCSEALSCCKVPKFGTLQLHGVVLELLEMAKATIVRRELDEVVLAEESVLAV
jgi:hypothetical protein